MFRPGKTGLFFASPAWPCSTDACRAACVDMLQAHARETAHSRETAVFNIDGTGLPPRRLATRETPGWVRLRLFQNYINVIEKDIGGFTHFQQKIICGFIEVRMRVLFGADIEPALLRLCTLCGVDMLHRYLHIIGPRQCGKTLTVMRCMGAFAAVMARDSIMMLHLNKSTAAKDMSNFETTAKICDATTVRKAGFSADRDSSMRLVRSGGSTIVQLQIAKGINVRLPVRAVRARLPIRNVRPRRREHHAPLPRLGSYVPARGRSGVRAAHAAVDRGRAARARRQGVPGCVRALGLRRRPAHVFRHRRVRFFVRRHGAPAAAWLVVLGGDQLDTPVAVELVMKGVYSICDFSHCSRAATKSRYVFALTASAFSKISPGVMICDFSNAASRTATSSRTNISNTRMTSLRMRTTKFW